MVTCQPNMQVHDDLAALFSRNLTLHPELQSQVQAQAQEQQPRTATQETSMLDIPREQPADYRTEATATHPSSKPNSTPITYSISQHYTHSAHLHRQAVSQAQQEQQQPAHETHQHQRRSSEPAQTEQLTAEMVLSQSGVDPTVLSPSQIQLFRISDPPQQARLVELWRVAPPTSNQDNPSLAWTTTTYEQEELWAKVRYDRALEATRTRQHDNLIMSLDGTPVQTDDSRWLASSNVEPYMMSGYEELMRRDQERQQRQQAESSPPNVFSHFGSAVGTTRNQAYSRATDPVYKGSIGDWPVHPQFGVPTGNMEVMEIM